MKIRVEFIQNVNNAKSFPLAHKKHPLTKQFEGVWTKFQNWEKHPPIVAWDGENIVAFHAATFNKRLYVNSYYQFVDEEYRGKGVAGAMFDFLLKEAHKRKLERWKTTCKIGLDGDQFYQGFGFKPIARDNSFHYYDAYIGDVSCAAEQIAKKYVPETLPVKVVEAHLKKGHVML